ncbi:MAG: M67 family metallopeptidase [Cyanobacteria bacterium K_DeepCast_35m_m2_023]|nr:M67 family metallopeptidase [Cyanobacteria bacterium K_DeepCast_35m_m2_023]
MAAQPPENLSIDAQALTVLASVLTAARPVEGCALLLGTSASSCWRVQQIWPALNSWPERAERQRRFLLDPREQLLAQRWARQRGLQVLGCAHSHPASAPRPSPTDLQLNFPPALLLIAGQTSGQPALLGWTWACWWLPEAEPGLPAQSACSVPWRMDAEPSAAFATARPVAHASS